MFSDRLLTEKGDQEARRYLLANKLMKATPENVAGIEHITVAPGQLDPEVLKKVMEQMGTAIMGTGRASGEKRAFEAAKEAVNSPLLEDISISGARGLLMNLTGPPDMTMDEIDEASSYIKGEVDEDADIFWGVVFDDNMADEVQITVIATGIDQDHYGKVVRLRDVTANEAVDSWTVRQNGESLDTPTFQRVKEEEETPEEKQEALNPPKRGFLKKVLFKDNLDYPTFLRAKAD